MVDCGSSRCAQDRRVLKKELLTWTKKVPIMLGLEQIAERYSSRNAFHDRMEPFKCLEPTEPEDWAPSNTCCFCHTDKNSPVGQAETGTDQGDSLKPEPETIEGFDYYQHYLPFNYHSPVPLEDPSLDNNKPLDLSASAQTRNHGNHANSDLGNQMVEQSPQPLVELKVPQVTNKIGKKKDMAGKRSYTEDDLSSAVNDIRSGKLGTRRAAALYGIPRSTLRNKIFRMESENAYEQPCPGNLSMSDLLQNMANHEAAKNDWTPDDWENRLDLLRRKHDLNAGLDRPFGMPPLFFNSRHLVECEKAFAMSSPFDYEVKLPFLQELVRKFAEHRMEAERAQCLGLPFLSELMQRVPSCSNSGGGLLTGPMPTGPVQLKIPSYKPVRSYNNGSQRGDDSTEDDLSPPLERDIPSPVPVPSNKINDTLKDIIAKNIAEKVRSRVQPSDPEFMKKMCPEDMPVDMNGYSLKHGRELPDEPVPPTKKVKREAKSTEKAPQDAHPYDFDSQDQKTSEEADNKPLKKTRPKRGQYRKYNSQLLLEAVRAVQRGEMSVHRAGSYFGVPHSTLEYKVKERHLMRQKKPRESRAKKAATASNTSTSKSSPGLNIPNPGSSGPAVNPEAGNKVPLKGSDTTSYDADDDLEAGEIPSQPPATSVPDSNEHSTSSYQDHSPGSSIALDTPRLEPESLHSMSSLLNAAAMSGLPLPGAPPGMPNFFMGGNLPMGFGWPPLMNAGMPLGLPDPAMAAACLPGYGINLSASDLLKKLQRKVQAQTSPNTTRPSQGGSTHDTAQSLQGNHGNKSTSSQVVVK